MITARGGGCPSGRPGPGTGLVNRHDPLLTTLTVRDLDPPFGATGAVVAGVNRGTQNRLICIAVCADHGPESPSSADERALLARISMQWPVFRQQHRSAELFSHSAPKAAPNEYEAANYRAVQRVRTCRSSR
jgi:hypothetical protein